MNHDYVACIASGISLVCGGIALKTCQIIKNHEKAREHFIVMKPIIVKHLNSMYYDCLRLMSNSQDSGAVSELSRNLNYLNHITINDKIYSITNFSHTTISHVKFIHTVLRLLLINGNASQFMNQINYFNKLYYKFSVAYQRVYNRELSPILLTANQVNNINNVNLDKDSQSNVLVH